jgi:Peptidase C39 family
MNHMLWPTLPLTALLFWLGTKAGTRLTLAASRLAFLIFAMALAAPGILFAAYYTKLLGEPIWLYQFRAMPGTELTAAGVGLVAGFIHQARHKHPILKKQLRVLTVPAILAVIIAAPYVKPLIRPLNRSLLAEQWKDGVCLQSTPSTCGPASAATIVRSLGKDVKEAELAQESFTNAGGTENWYLARALRKRGFEVEFRPVAPGTTEFPTSAVAGVKLAQGAGHFIALISKEGASYVASDPLTGRFTATLAELKSDYQFTGFFLVIK